MPLARSHGSKQAYHETVPRFGTLPPLDRSGQLHFVAFLQPSWCRSHTFTCLQELLLLELCNAQGQKEKIAKEVADTYDRGTLNHLVSLVVACAPFFVKVY